MVGETARQRDARMRVGLGSEVGDRLRVCRDYHGLSVMQTSIRSGIDPRTISRVEGGQLPNVLTLLRLCLTYGVSADDILGISDRKSRARTSSRYVPPKA